jgi:hypothetical protein
MPIPRHRPGSKGPTSSKRAESPTYVLQFGGEGWIGPTALTNSRFLTTQAVGLGWHSAAPSVLVFAHGLIELGKRSPHLDLPHHPQN